MTDRQSEYLRFLPPVYQGAGQSGIDPDFLIRFLLIFESILGRAIPPGGDGTPSKDHPPERSGMASLIDVLPDLFYPQLEPLFPGDAAFLPSLYVVSADGKTKELNPEAMALLESYVGAAPADSGEDWPEIVGTWLSAFLQWQAEGIGLELDDGWTLDEKRGALAGALNTFRQRGTAAEIQAAITALTDEVVKVSNTAITTAMSIGENTELADHYEAQDPVLAGNRAYSFLVEVFVSTWDITANEIRKRVETVEKIVATTKPAHTQAILRATPYWFKLGESSTVAVSTLLPVGPQQRKPFR